MKVFSRLLLTMVFASTVTSGKEVADVKSATLSVFVVHKFVYNYSTHSINSVETFISLVEETKIDARSSELQRSGDHVPTKTNAVNDKLFVLNSMDFVTIPWQSLSLLRSEKQDCKSLVGKEGAAEPVSFCPVRFRRYANPHIVWPRNLTASECLCEGSECSRRGLHTCVTVYSVRSIYKLFFGKSMVRIPVGCLCAVQKAVLVKSIIPKIVL